MFGQQGCRDGAEGGKGRCGAGDVSLCLAAEQARTGCMAQVLLQLCISLPGKFPLLSGGSCRTGLSRKHVKQNHERALHPSFVSVLKVNELDSSLFFFFLNLRAETIRSIIQLLGEGKQNQSIISERLVPEGEACET